MSDEFHDIDGWVPLTTAAGILGGTPLNVLMHIRRGQLAGREREGGWLVEAASLRALLVKRQAGEAPVTCAVSCARRTGGCSGCH